MNNERLNELKERAEKATKLAEEIGLLRGIRSVPYRNLKHGGSDGLDQTLQEQIWDAGRLAVLAQKEDELEALLNPLPPADQMPAPTLPAIEPLDRDRPFISTKSTGPDEVRVTCGDEVVSPLLATPLKIWDANSSL